MRTDSPTASLTLEALGVPVRLDGLSPEVSVVVRRAWSSCLLPAHAAAAAAVDTTEVIGSVAAQLEIIAQRVTVTALAQRAGELLLLHAAALADPVSRRAAVLVGPSGTGKSTLSRVLGTQFTYLGDEAAAVDDTGRVLAYPKPISLIEVEGEPKVQTAPQDLGLSVGSGWYDVAAVVLLTRTDVVQPVVFEEPTVRAIAMLAEHTSYLASLDRPLHRVAGTLHRAGGLKLVEYAEADHLRPLLTDWLA